MAEAPSVAAAESAAAYCVATAEWAFGRGNMPSVAESQRYDAANGALFPEGEARGGGAVATATQGLPLLCRLLCAGARAAAAAGPAARGGRTSAEGLIALDELVVAYTRVCIAARRLAAAPGAGFAPAAARARRTLRAGGAAPRRCRRVAGRRGGGAARARRGLCRSFAQFAGGAPAAALPWR